MTEEPIRLSNTAFAITERCTLRCKLCIAFIPYHKNPRHLTVEEVETILDRYFRIISSVERFGITGGEPLLHPALLRICEIVNGYFGQIDKTIDITTNGTLDFKNDVLCFMERYKERIRVIISDYGSLSPKAQPLAEQLRSLGVGVRVEEYNGESLLYGGWVDCTDHTLKHVTLEDRDAQGRSCHYKNKRGYPIRNGQLHNCARSYWRMRQGIIPRNPEEYLDLLDTSASIEEQRETLRRLHEKASVTSCAYCWGSASDCERHTPAEQLGSEI